jgi:hypothetical protein
MREKTEGRRGIGGGGGGGGGEETTFVLPFCVVI